MANLNPSDILQLLLATPDSVVSLEDGAYQRWMSEVRVADSAFSDGTLVPIKPRSEYLPNLADQAERSKALGLTRWELGVTPTGLVHALGLSEVVVDFVVRELVPRCSQCLVSMNRPRALRDLALPKEGYLIAAPVEVPERVSLVERCEMLGSERALVSSKIVRVDLISEEEGAPIVALVSARDDAQLNEGVESWFSRGGGPLALYHATTREDEVVLLDVISRRWTCGTCSQSVSSPTRGLLLNLSACGTCRGEGWLLDRAGRLTACRDCDGFGSVDDVRRYECGGVELCRLAELTFRDLRGVVERNSGNETVRLRAALAVIEEFGFGRYPIASSVGTLSEGERVLLTTLIGQLSQVTGAKYVVDGAYLQGDSIAELSGEARTALRVVVPRPAAQSFSSKASNVTTESIRLMGLNSAGLVVPEVEFPLGALSIVGGAPGTGKSLLLTEISRRFAKRKKMAHLASFGGIKRCHLCGPVSASTVSLLDLLFLDGDVAEEIARTRVAQQEGVTAGDLSRASARYRCAVCGGSGRIGILSESSEVQKQECDECWGILYDWRVADLPLLGRTAADVLKTPLAEVSQLLWRDPAVSFVLERVSSGLERSVTLATPCLDLSVEERGFVALAARLARLVAPLNEKRARLGGLAGELVLVDGPRTLTSCHLTIIMDLLGDLIGSGATVICADLPPGLESDGAHVLRLRAAGEGMAFEEKRAFADSRYARASVVG
jgi:hypothetical protein